MRDVMQRTDSLNNARRTTEISRDQRPQAIALFTMLDHLSLRVMMIQVRMRKTNPGNRHQRETRGTETRSVSAPGSSFRELSEGGGGEL